jgi:hypothetical protein
MAEVAPPVLPQYFYRYRSLGNPDSHNILQREIDAIVNYYIWCADFLTLNDITEGDFNLTLRLAKKPHAGAALDAITTGQTSVGIASLSDTLDNDLMWTHYANDWSGLCIEYHAQRLVAALPPEATIVRMAYNEKPSWVGVNDAKDIDAAVKKVFSQKKFTWAYEREWRLLGTKERNFITDKKAVRCVYFGPRLSLEHNTPLLTALSKAGIKYKQIQVKGYSVQVVPYKPIRRF